jgi:hypothetical protein
MGLPDERGHADIFEHHYSGPSTFATRQTSPLPA